MCYIFKENEITPIQAEEDISVFKVGYLRSGNFVSINKGSHYQFKIVKTVENFWEKMRVGPLEGERITRDGLYSIALEEKAKEYLDDVIRYASFPEGFQVRIFKAYIPKGSKYLKTKDGFCISDNLVVINKTLDYFPKLDKDFLESFGERIKPYVPENIISGS